MKRTAVVVVGGGATGTGIARDLAMRGIEVTLCERGGLGAGTTGRSHGLLHSGARYATSDPASAEHCIQENRILRDIAGEAIADTGGLFVRLAEDDPEYVRTLRSACENLDIPTRELDAKQARRRVPALDRSVETALTVPDAVIYPSRLVAATAESARRHGADIQTQTPVREVVVDDGQVIGVETGDERIEADHVVNAAGAWAGTVAELSGVDLPMAPTKGVMVAVDNPSIDTVINRCRPPADGDIAVPHRDTIVLGTTSTPVEDPENFPKEDEAVESMIRAGAEMLPAVAEADIDRVYWGVRPLYGGSGGHGRNASRGFQVFDHTDDGRPGLTTVTGGKLTTYRLMAEAVSDAVCKRLGVAESCRTDVESLPAEDVDKLVAEFGAAGPADSGVVDPDSAG